MGQKILIVEDDLIIAKLLKMYLSDEGYSTEIVSDGALAIDAIREYQPDIVLLDLMLPGMSGAEICQSARTFYNGMIIVITASADELSEVSLFKFGADDYVTKPVKANILLARIEAMLRRNPQIAASSGINNSLRLDDDAKRAFFNGMEIKLTDSEFDVFSVLFKNYGHPVSREDCCKAVRGIEYKSSDRTIDMRVSGLRKKLQVSGLEHVVIKTIRSKGYALVDN